MLSTELVFKELSSAAFLRQGPGNLAVRSQVAHRGRGIRTYSLNLQEIQGALHVSATIQSYIGLLLESIALLLLPKNCDSTDSEILLQKPRAAQLPTLSFCIGCAHPKPLLI